MAIDYGSNRQFIQPSMSPSILSVSLTGNTIIAQWWRKGEGEERNGCLKWLQTAKLWTRPTMGRGRKHWQKMKFHRTAKATRVFRILWCSFCLHNGKGHCWPSETRGQEHVTSPVRQETSQCSLLYTTKTALSMHIRNKAWKCNFGNSGQWNTANKECGSLNIFIS